MRPVHYEFSLHRAHCGVRLSLKTHQTKNPHSVTCPKCRPGARRDIPEYDRRNGQ